jgi:acid phosphatase family membrane protein YuiD
MPAFKEQLKLFFTNPIFLSCLFSWLSAQFLKTIINIIYGRIHSIGELMENLIWRTGGMPSSHSALVAAMCTTIGFRSGFNSDIFFMSLVFFFVTIRDAVGVRRSAGMQAQKINKIGKELKEKGLLDEYNSLKEINGHTPLQVVMGCVLGFLIGLSFSLLK